MKRTITILKRIAISAGALAILIYFSLPSIRRWGESAKCGDNMIAINFCCCYLWPDDHGGNLPTDFLSMSNELNNPSILICPSDFSRHSSTNWASFSSNNCSYEIVNSGIKSNEINKVFIRCKIHGFVGMTDGGVYDTKGKRIRKW